MATQPITDTTGILEEFRIEFLECWHQWPNKGFFLTLLALWLALFQFLGSSVLGYVNTPSLLKWMYLAYQPGLGTDDAHGMIIPFLVLGLFWWKRKELVSLKMYTWWPALLLVGLGLLIHVAGYAVQQPRVSIVGMFIGIYGLMGLAWGPELLRHGFFPFFLFAFSVPLGTLAEGITFPLRLLVCRLVEILSHNILAIDVIRNGTALIDPANTYHYDVAAACSGIRSLIATFLITTIYGFVVFKPMWKRVLLILAAVPFAVLGNLLRMLIIIIAAEMGGREWGDWVHENSITSLIPYIPAILGLIWLGRWLEGPAAPNQSSSRPGPGGAGPLPAQPATKGLP